MRTFLITYELKYDDAPPTTEAEVVGIAKGGEDDLADRFWAGEPGLQGEGTVLFAAVRELPPTPKGFVLRTLGQIGFDRYGDEGRPVSWKTFDGREMPRWDSDLPHMSETRRRWEEAARDIADEVLVTEDNRLRAAVDQLTVERDEARALAQRLEEGKPAQARSEAIRARSLLRELAGALLARRHVEEARSLGDLEGPPDLAEVGDRLIEFLPIDLASEVPEDLRDGAREAIGARRAELATDAGLGARVKVECALMLEAALGGEEVTRG